MGIDEPGKDEAAGNVQHFGVVVTIDELANLAEIDDAPALDCDERAIDHGRVRP